MIKNILDRLKHENMLEGIEIVIEDRSGGRKIIYGRDITGFDRSRVFFAGGETGYERFSVSLDSVMEIRIKGKPVFMKKRQIKRIYPKK